MKLRKNPKKQNSPRGEVQGIRIKNLRSGESLSMDLIISEASATKQGRNTRFSYSSHNLNLLIKERSLSDCLDLLEKLGYTGDAAIFVLGSLQKGVCP